MTSENSRNTKKNLCEIYVGNIPQDLNEDDILDLFSEFDGIRLRSFYRRGTKVFCFMICKNVEDVIQVVQTMNRKEIRGRYLSVKAMDESLQDAIKSGKIHEISFRDSLKLKHDEVDRRYPSSSNPNWRDSKSSEDYLSSEEYPARQNRLQDQSVDHSVHSFDFNVPSHQTCDSKVNTKVNVKKNSFETSCVEKSENRSSIDYHNSDSPPPLEINRAFENLLISPNSVCHQSLCHHHSVKANNDCSNCHTKRNQAFCNLAECQDSKTKPLNPPKHSPIQAPCDVYRSDSYSRDVRHNYRKQSDTESTSYDLEYEMPAAVLSVANFPYGASDVEIYELFSDYDPLDVIMVCNLPSEKVTEALLTFADRERAMDAIMDLDNTQYRRRTLIVTDAEDNSTIPELMYFINKRNFF